ncbi:hypothetical protein CDAR_71621 [Caerostris darwini]|uniref:Secreted protein n=1 Tax=Caerostris darwini TaxID=1538125 RepID=A0AAV4M736_9ARAC|nr:hypothetical protein CDAR_71621 [Caerostris darwini]
MCGESFWLEWLWFRFICGPVLRERGRLHNLSNQRISRSMGHPVISRRHFGLLVFDVLRMSAQPLFESTAMETMCQDRAIQCLNCCINGYLFWGCNVVG